MYKKELLQEYKIKNKLTRDYFCKPLDISYSYACKLLTGHITPSWKIAKRVAKFLKMDITEIFDEETYITIDKKVEDAIRLMQHYEPEEGYFLAFSGGKDSVVLYDIAVKAGVKFDVHYCNTQIDPPELRLFIKKYYPDIDWINPKLSMFQLIEKHRMLPTRRIRYCCRHLKETTAKGRVLLDGVRASESYTRSLYDRYNVRKDKEILHGILDWTETEIWLYIITRKLPYCKLYDEGFTRLGCIGCPMATRKQREFEFERYPSIREGFKRALRNAYAKKPNTYFGTDIEAYFEWWMSEESVDNIDKFKGWQ